MLSCSAAGPRPRRAEIYWTVYDERLYMTRAPNETYEVSRAVARIHAGVLALVCAILGGVGLFATTAWLLIKGGSQVGAHLQLLSQYFLGYSVTWTGSIVGFLYGALTGALVGWTLGTVYNVVAGLRE